MRRMAFWQRLSLEPALVRAGAGVAGLTALLLAAPEPVLANRTAVAGLVLLAALPALFPAGPWVTVVVLATAGGWVLATTGERVATSQVLALAAALYLLHSLATLAATLPYDAAVAPEVALGWVVRALAVVAVASLLSAAVLTGVARLGGGAYPLATVAGLALAAGLAALLSSSARRRRPSPSR